MINAIIVDDEQHCVDRLIYLVKEYCADDVQITNVFNTVEAAFEGIQKSPPAVLFLDIQIHHQTGFDLLRKLGSIDFNVVFTTAYEQYAIKAFKFSAVDYLLKPIDIDDFTDTIARIKSQTQRKPEKESIEMLVQNLKNVGAQKKLAVPTSNGLTFLTIPEITYCKSDVNYTTIYMKDNSSLMVAKTLKEFDGLLRDFNFFRVHNSYLVNLDFIKSYTKGKGGYISLLNGKEIEVSTRRKDEFLQRLTNL